MPDVKLRCPYGYLPDGDRKETFKEQVADIVAKALDCVGYDGQPIDLTGDQIDIEIVTYRLADVRFGAVVLMEVCGYDYTARMTDIEQRLLKIKAELSAIVSELFAMDGKEPLKISFIPIPDGCWV